MSFNAMYGAHVKMYIHVLRLIFFLWGALSSLYMNLDNIHDIYMYVICTADRVFIYINYLYIYGFH